MSDLPSFWSLAHGVTARLPIMRLNSTRRTVVALKILSALILAAGALVAVPSTVSAVDSNCPTASGSLSGSGTLGSPYLVQSKEDLQLIKTNSTYRSQEFLQTQDINMQQTPGTDCLWDRGISGSFSGTYDGGGFEVTGVNITTTQAKAGLFEDVTNGTVRRLGFTGNVTSTSTSATAYVGTLVGYAFGASIEDAYATGNVSSTYTDINYPGTGGLVGYARSGTQISGSHATGDVTAVLTAGGLIGRTEASSPVVTISTSYATGNVRVTSKNAGGLAGFLYSATVAESYATGNVTATAAASANTHLGAFAGVLDVVNVTDSFATGGVSGGLNQVGGFAGDYGSTSTTTATRTFTIMSSGLAPDAGATQSGGFAGYNGNVTNSAATSFWDYENTPYAQDNSGTGSGNSVGAKGRTTEELKSITTYTDGTVGVDWNTGGATNIAEGYDATYTWGMCSAVNDGYPFLTAFYSSDPCTNPSPAPSGGSAPAWPVFTFQTPGGGECTVISPQHPQLNTWFTLPGADALCYEKDSVLTGWSIPGQDWAFAPGRRVWVVASQVFTSVLEHEWVTIEYDSNIDANDACLSDGVDLPVPDRTGITHIPRGVITEQPLWDTPVCTAPGYEFIGWTMDNPYSDPTILRKDARMPSPAVNSDGDAANTIHLYAMWKYVG